MIELRDTANRCEHEQMSARVRRFGPPGSDRVYDSHADEIAITVDVCVDCQLIRLANRQVYFEGDSPWISIGRVEIIVGHMMEILHDSGKADALHLLRRYISVEAKREKKQELLNEQLIEDSWFDDA